MRPGGQRGATWASRGWGEGLGRPGGPQLDTWELCRRQPAQFGKGGVGEVRGIKEGLQPRAGRLWPATPGPHLRVQDRGGGPHWPTLANGPVRPPSLARGALAAT